MNIIFKLHGMEFIFDYASISGKSTLKFGSKDRKQVVDDYQ